ncbi:hypothetical protein Y032_0109g90 [Ancylostoma ceylanicum]|uniref:Uncharacterized protein n=1 Tax=Ancylostoma ceylanicum TaxID=53326 RepID=A0A016TEY7_9BILA|nr:hypothetical protein Y032_0109g90 [Ancylostoma ceylanicum]
MFLVEWRELRRVLARCSMSSASRPPPLATVSNDGAARMYSLIHDCSSASELNTSEVIFSLRRFRLRVFRLCPATAEKKRRPFVY